MRLVMMLLVALALPLSAAVGDELTTKPSKYAVKETVDRLTTALKEKGITPAAPSTMPRRRRRPDWN